MQEERTRAQVEYIESVRDSKKTYMTVTAYCPCATCCGWRINRHGNPVYNYGSQKGSRKKIGYTSTGTKADIGTIAADPRAILTEPDWKYRDMVLGLSKILVELCVAITLTSSFIRIVKLCAGV